MEQVLQIIPADGWIAVFAKRNEDGEVELITVRLVYWGLQKDGFVSGFGPNLIEPCEEAPDFVGFIHESESPETLQEDAERVISLKEKHERKRARLEAAGFRRVRYDERSGWRGPDSGRLLTQNEALKLLDETGA